MIEMTIFGIFTSPASVEEKGIDKLIDEKHYPSRQINDKEEQLKDKKYDRERKRSFEKKQKEGGVYKRGTIKGAKSSSREDPRERTRKLFIKKELRTRYRE